MLLMHLLHTCVDLRTAIDAMRHMKYRSSCLAVYLWINEYVLPSERCSYVPEARQSLCCLVSSPWQDRSLQGLPSAAQLLQEVALLDDVIPPGAWGPRRLPPPPPPPLAVTDAPNVPEPPDDVCFLPPPTTPDPYGPSTTTKTQCTFFLTFIIISFLFQAARNAEIKLW